MDRARATDVVAKLREAGYEAYFAGGCVRDRLLGIEPRDYDVATAASPDTVEDLFADTRAVGRRFAVVLVRSGEDWIEVATFRKDGPYGDGRRPDRVDFTDAKTDAARRDFTINALFEDPVDGRIVDFTGGNLVGHLAPILLGLGELLGELRRDQLWLGIGSDRHAGPGSSTAPSSMRRAAT